jgi:hypothetical protein
LAKQPAATNPKAANANEEGPGTSLTPTRSANRGWLVRQFPPPIPVDVVSWPKIEVALALPAQIGALGAPPISGKSSSVTVLPKL